MNSSPESTGRAALRAGTAGNAELSSVPVPVERVVVLGGHGDPVVGEPWVADLTRACDGLDLFAVDWPGLWSRWDEAVSFASLVDEVRALAGPSTALVGHGLGGLVALQVACETDSAAAVAIGAPVETTVGRSAGPRVTRRRAPNGMPVSFTIPQRFADEVASVLARATVPPCRTLLLFGTADSQAAASQWTSVPRCGVGPSVVLIDRCPHRFMDADADREAVVAVVAEFLTER